MRRFELRTTLKLPGELIRSRLVLAEYKLSAFFLDDIVRLPFDSNSTKVGVSQTAFYRFFLAVMTSSLPVRNSHAWYFS